MPSAAVLPVWPSRVRGEQKQDAKALALHFLVPNLVRIHSTESHHALGQNEVSNSRGPKEWLRLRRWQMEATKFCESSREYHAYMPTQDPVGGEPE